MLFQPELKPNKEKKLIVIPSAPNCTKRNVIRRFGCLLVGHSWGGFDNNICQKCNKNAVGLPKFINPPLPPKRKPP